MEFEWNEAKRREVFATREVDILYAALIFEGPVFVSKDNRKDYGEDRWIALGAVEDECYVVVYTVRENAVRLITAWRGGRNDRQQYQERLTCQPAGDAWSG